MKCSGIVALLAANALLDTGCATVVNGRTQAINVTSEPPGALVFIGKNLVGVTPARVILERKRSDIVLRLEKECYAPQSVALKQGVSPWLAGDLAYGVLQLPVGNARTAVTSAALVLGIDLLTGAANRLGPSKVHMRLEAQAPVPGLTDEDRAEARKIAREWVRANSRPRE